MTNIFINITPCLSAFVTESEVGGELQSGCKMVPVCAGTQIDWMFYPQLIEKLRQGSEGIHF